MARRGGGAKLIRRAWSVAGALALALGLLSCDGNQVVQPPATGVLWERLTPLGFIEALFPDVGDDSLVYSTNVPVQVGVDGGGNPIFQSFGRIAVSGLDGTNPLRIGFLGAAPWNNLRPRWVSSQRIVFMDNRQGSYDIWYKDLNTFAEYRLASFSTHETAPAPRPGTAGLAYIELTPPATSAYGFGRVVLIPDTTATPISRIYLTPDTLLCGDPDWDPTGTKLCFTVVDNSNFTQHIYTMNLAPGDSLPVQITAGPTHDFQPRWSPDGGRIVFASDRTARSGIWVVHPQGEAAGLKLVSFDDSNASVFTPTWTPDGMNLIVSSNGRGGVRSLWLLSNLPVFGF
jgi:hypothetical protein